jgi:hypothetical protein
MSFFSPIKERGGLGGGGGLPNNIKILNFFTKWRKLATGKKKEKRKRKNHFF